MNIVDASARRLMAGDLEAVFVPAHGMLGASLRHKGRLGIGVRRSIRADAVR